MKEALQKSKLIKFEEGSIEQILADQFGISKQILNLDHSLFSMTIKNDELTFHLKREMSLILWHNDFIIEKSISDINFMDFILPVHYENSYEDILNITRHFSISEYSEDHEEHQFNLMCLIALCFFDKKFSYIKSLSDIDRPVPIQFFLNILRNNIGMGVGYKDQNNQIVAGKLTAARIAKNWFSSIIEIVIMIVSKGKEGYVTGQYTIELPVIKQAQTLEDIGLIDITPKIKQDLEMRGRKYIRYVENPSYAQYNGFAYRSGGHWGNIRLSISGRIMIDISAMRILNSRISDRWYIGNPFHNEESTSSVVDEDCLWMCPPYVYGFAFSTKDWLQMNIDCVSDIEFSQTAFDELIVPEIYKSIFISCLTNDMPSLDSIDGKGNGKIFLLFGPPGTGKTLSAESVAELLHKPLYFVSVGELGTTPETMESNLSQIMDVAQSWDAIVLLDEVDVFAAKRSSSDIQKNAMTAILLRLLERFNGVMFMTTNLLDNLDEAFVSRSTATIPYAALSCNDREKIWYSLLGRVEKEGIAVDKEVYDSLSFLSSEYILNGREIKNSIRLAYSLSVAKDKKVLTREIIDTVLALKQSINNF